MKYNLSMTEGEFLGLCKVVEGVFGRVLDAASLRGALSSVSVPAEPPLANPEEVPLEVEKPLARVLHLTPKAAPSPVVLDERAIRHIEKGRTLFTEMAVLWASNLGIEGAPQPDRVGLLRNVATGPDSGAVLHYVSSVGGLTYATNAAMGIEAFRLKRACDHVGDDDAPGYLRAAETPEEEEAARRACVVAVSINIAQVSSLFFSDLCAMYEHRDIYRED